jgi:hypothetical protein
MPDMITDEMSAEIEARFQEAEIQKIVDENVKKINDFPATVREYRQYRYPSPENSNVLVRATELEDFSYFWCLMYEQSREKLLREIADLIIPALPELHPDPTLVQLEIMRIEKLIRVIEFLPLGYSFFETDKYKTYRDNGNNAVYDTSTHKLAKQEAVILSKAEYDALKGFHDKHKGTIAKMEARKKSNLAQLLEKHKTNGSLSNQDAKRLASEIAKARSQGFGSLRIYREHLKKKENGTD